MLPSVKKAAAAATVGNVDAKKVATNEQAIPIPYFAGRAWLPIIWAQSNIYYPKTKAVSQKVGKSKQVTGYDYYGSLIGVLACARFDYIEAIEVAGKVVWSGTITRGGGHVDHSGDIVVDGVGTFRVYWGNPAQPREDLVLQYDAILDLPYGEAVSGGDREYHSHYLDQPILAVKDLFFGNNNATPPTIRVLAERAAEFAGLPNDRTREGTNPVTAMAEVIGNEFYGLGQPALVNVASANTLAGDVRRDTDVAVPSDPTHVAAMGFFSPFLDRQTSARDFFAELMDHYDGWIRPSGAEFYFGQFPHDGITPGGLTELTYHDFITRPRFEPPGGTDGLVTEVNVVHIDRDDNMEKAATPVPNPSARRRLGFANPRTFDRPFVITEYQAREQGNQIARQFSRDEESCEVSIRREKVVGLHAGDRFLLTDNVSASSQVVRITQRTDPSSGGEVQLRLVLERGLAPVAYVPPPLAQPILPEPDPVVIANAKMFQWPPFGDYAEVPTFVPLAERPAAYVAGYSLHFSVADVTYDKIATVGKWAVRGTHSGAVLAGTLTFNLALSGQDLAIVAAQSDAAKNDDTLLIFHGTEISSGGDVVALGGGVYQFTVLRGRRGSTAAGHADASEVYVALRSELQVVQHADIPVTAVNRYFKLASYTKSDEQDLAAALKLTVAVAATTVAVPTGLAATVGTGKVVNLAWDVGPGYVEEYGVYRATAGSGGPYTKIAQIRATRFVDVSVTLATPYWYKLTALTGDGTQESAQTAFATATPSLIAVGTVSTTAPSDPAPGTFNSSNTKFAGDGTVTARIVLNNPAMPAGANLLNVQYRRDGGTGYIVTDQKTAGGGTSEIDDLAPGTGYRTYHQAFSEFGYGSNVIESTGSPFTTPNAGAPLRPTGATLSTSDPSLAQAAVRFYPDPLGGSTRTKIPVIKLSWTPPTAPDISHYIVTTDNNAGGVPGLYCDTSIKVPAATAPSCLIYWGDGGVITTEIVAVTKSGVSSPPSVATTGTPSASYGSQSMAQQEASGIAVTGGTAANVTATNMTLSSVSSQSGARSAIGLGSIATQAANNVTITGGNITGLTDFECDFIDASGTSVDINDVNVRIRVSGSNVIVLNKDIPGITINGDQVLTARQTRPGAPTAADIDTCLLAHGIWA